MKTILRLVLLLTLTPVAYGAGVARAPAVVDEGRAPAVESIEVVVESTIASDLAYGVKGDV